MEACQFLALSLMAVVLVRGSKMAHLIAACSPAGLTSKRAGHEYKRREKVQVQGKRRVWGTLKACSSSAVKQAICRLTETAKENILSKRKYKTMRNNKIRWWHIISGDEDNLEKLEKEWEVVKAQTGWKLEKCYMDEENFLKAVTPLLP